MGVFFSSKIDSTPSHLISVQTAPLLRRGCWEVGESSCVLVSAPETSAPHRRADERGRGPQLLLWRGEGRAGGPPGENSGGQETPQSPACQPRGDGPLEKPGLGPLLEGPQALVTLSAGAAGPPCLPGTVQPRVSANAAVPALTRY